MHAAPQIQDCYQAVSVTNDVAWCGQWGGGMYATIHAAPKVQVQAGTSEHTSGCGTSPYCWLGQWYVHIRHREPRPTSRHQSRRRHRRNRLTGRHEEDGRRSAPARSQSVVDKRRGRRRAAMAET